MKKKLIPVAEPTTSQIVAPHEKSTFKGYTIEELRIQRALIDVRREYVKEKLQNDFSRLVSDPFSREGGGGQSKIWSVGGKLLNLLSYSDYISLGIGLFNNGRKLIGMFRRKK